MDMNSKNLKFTAQYQRALNEMLNGAETEQTIMLLDAFGLSDNYYGEKNAYILFGRKHIDVESIWHDNERVYIHVNCTDFEADVEVNSLSDRNIRRVLKLVYNKYINNLEEGIYNE